MLDANLAEQQKQLGLDLVEVSNPVFLETMRGVARMLARKLGEITADDVREYYDRHVGSLGVKPTSPNAWGALFKTKEWECVGFIKSRQVQGHGNMIRKWRLTTER